ncbi:hypothetical protein H4R34_001902 [Dimargaris verticillata]|uniref:Uncharacterized protein n=1 Tax=Dimargaris verticillata TaxID=2761393 RepID=A0A9W8B4P4_9FUNG|nr:hypothetical protein H4R34_001902 [Dimargaris verticillata]
MRFQISVLTFALVAVAVRVYAVRSTRLVDLQAVYDNLLLQHRQEFRNDPAMQQELQEWYALPDNTRVDKFTHLVDHTLAEFGAPVLYKLANQWPPERLVVYRDLQNRFVIRVNQKPALLDTDDVSYDKGLIRTMVIPTAKFYDIVDADTEDCPFLNEMARTAIRLFS